MTYKKAHVVEYDLHDLSDKFVYVGRLFTESKVKYIKHAVVINIEKIVEASGEVFKILVNSKWNDVTETKIVIGGEWKNVVSSNIIDRKSVV